MIPQEVLADREAEMAVIGSVLLEDSVMNELIPFLKGDHFHSANLGGIYGIFVDMWNSRQAIDAITVKRECEVRKYDPEVLVECAEASVTPAHAAHYGKVVLELAHLRVLQNAVLQAAQILEDKPDPRMVATDLAKAAATVHDEQSVGTAVVRAKDGILEAVELAKREGTDSSTDTLPWRICPTFDMRGAVLRATDFPIIAARPGVGKTTFALQWAKVTAQRTGRAVVYVSLETPARDLWLKVACNHAGVPEPQGKPLGSEDAERLSKASEELEALCPLHIIDAPPSDLSALLALMQRLKDTLDPVAFVIDYLGLIEAPRTKGPYEAVSKVSRSLRLFALKTGTVVVPVHQLSRAMEQQKRAPAMHDLRDSGQLEQDATHIVFLHQERVMEDNHNIRDVVAILAKARRGGAPAVQPLRLMGDLSRFTQRSRVETRETPA